MPDKSSRTVIGPLTTTFTPPGTCTTVYVQAASEPDGTMGAHCPPLGGSDFVLPVFTTACYPPKSDGAPEPSTPINGWGFYSPGIVCPAGYTSACSATFNGDEGWDQEYVMTQGETAVGCCPRGFGCARIDDAQSCTSTAGSGDVVTVSKCPTEPFSQTLTLPGTLTGSQTEQAVSSQFIQAPMIEIRWRSTDLPSSTAPPNSKNSNAISGGGGGGGGGDGGSEGKSSSDSGLSTGTKAAIGVVIPVVLIAAIILVLLFRKRMQRSRQTQNQSYTAGREHSRPIPLLDRYDGYGKRSAYSGSPGAPMSELEGERPELEDSGYKPAQANPVYEVEDTSHLDRR